MSDVAAFLAMMDAPLLAGILAMIWRLDRRLLMIEIIMQKGKP